MKTRKASPTESYLDDTRRQLIELLGCIDTAWDVCGKDRDWAEDEEVQANAEWMHRVLCEPNEASETDTSFGVSR